MTSPASATTAASATAAIATAHAWGAGLAAGAGLCGALVTRGLTGRLITDVAVDATTWLATWAAGALLSWACLWGGLIAARETTATTTTAPGATAVHALRAAALLIGALLAVVVDGAWLAPVAGDTGTLAAGAALTAAVAIAARRRPRRAATTTTTMTRTTTTTSAPPLARGRLGAVNAASAASGAFFTAAPGAAGAAIAAHLTDATLGASSVAHDVVGGAALVGAVGGALGVAIAAGRGALSSPRLRPALFVAAAVLVSLAGAGWDTVPGLLVDGARPASFLAAEAWRFVVAVLLLGPPAAALTALTLLPVLGAVEGDDDVRGWRAAALVGLGGAAGIIAGAAGALLVVVPALGSRGALTLVTLGLLVVGSALAFIGRRAAGSEPVGVWAAAVTWGTVAVLLPDWQWAAFATVDPTTLRPAKVAPRTALVAHAEDVAHGLVTRVKTRPSKRARATGARAAQALRHDGFVVADDDGRGGRGVRAAARRALVPLAHTRARTRALVAAAAPEPLVRALRAANVAVVDVVTPTTLPAAVRPRGRAQGDVGVVVVPGGARAALARAAGAYDVVVVEAPPLFAARTARLVDGALLAAAGASLRPGGVFALTFPWSGADVDVVVALVRSARAALPAVALFSVGDRGVLVGGDAAALESEATTMTAAPPPALPSLLVAGDDVTAWRVCSAGDVDRVLAARPAERVGRERFAWDAARAAWASPGARAVVDGLLALVPEDAAARRARLDAAFPPRSVKRRATATAPMGAR